MALERIKLYGFNNLTKALSFNIYDFCYAQTLEEQRAYIQYIDEQYNADRLTVILKNVTNMIGAEVLNVSKQDYDPQGASVTCLIAEQPIATYGADTLVAHLNKSHITVHTYPEYHPENHLATFRVDIDVATCGEITPLSTLDYLIDSFDSDVITMDYRVRGFTRDVHGNKVYIDHPIDSIQQFISSDTRQKYDAIDDNLQRVHLYHTRMRLKELSLEEYIFNQSMEQISHSKQQEMLQALTIEMDEIFKGKDVKRS